MHFVLLLRHECETFFFKFKDAVSGSNHTASNDTMVNNERRSGKHVEGYSRSLPQGMFT